jgi:uncharacterized membrane protein YesL
VTVDWSALTLAGAFVLGAAGGTVATLRVMRSVAAYLSGVPRRRDPPAG